MSALLNQGVYAGVLQTRQLTIVTLSEVVGSNKAQAFQRLMDSALSGLDFLFVYLDDILIASESATEHKEHLRQLFDRL